MLVSRRRYLPWVVFAAIGLGIALYFLPYRLAYPFDDTFITFRYAKNLSNGFGLVWNPGGAHTEGYTNFLFVLLLAIAHRLHLDLLLTSQWIGIIAVIASATLGYRIATRIARPIGWVAGLLIIADPFMWFNAMSGMETSLFVMLVLATWLAFLERSVTTAYVCAVLATLTRPEGAVLAAIIFVLDWRRRGFGPALRSAMSFIVPIACYAAWKLWYFGDLLPNSFYVKVVQVRTGVSAPLLPGFGAVKYFYSRNGLLLLFALTSLGYFWRHRPEAVSEFVFGWTWIVLMSAFYSASYLLMGKYGRFTLSIEAMLMVFVAIGAYFIVQHFRFRGLVWIALVAAFIVTQYTLREGSTIFGMHDDPNAAYQKLGEAITRIPDHEHLKIASADAGVLPYYSDATHIDLVGLNTNEIARMRSVNDVVGDVARSQPDVIFVPVRMAAGDSCATIFREGHGLIAQSYSRFVNGAEFMRYRSIGRLDIGYYQMDMLTDTTSRYYGALKTATHGQLSEPTRCYR